MRWIEVATTSDDTARPFTRGGLGTSAPATPRLVRTTRVVATMDHYRAPPDEEATIRREAIEPLARPLRISSVYRLSVIR